MSCDHGEDYMHNMHDKQYLKWQWFQQIQRFAPTLLHDSLHFFIILPDQFEQPKLYTCWKF
jgi:hypothetical protein